MARKRAAAWTLSALALFIAVGLPASEPQATTPFEIVQATRSERGWALVNRESEASGEARIVDREGRSQVLPLEPGESLFLLDDLAGRWIAGGTVVGESGADLLLASGESDTFRRLPVPAADTSVRLRVRAVPLTDGEQLVGLAWLEGSGHRTLAVRASAWDGESWSPPETVSPLGPGSQTGLVGTVLADGSWLLVWAAYDGEDDELRWSRRTDAGWTEPAPVHAGNRVQDVRPAVVATGDGPLVAWSRFDGTTYRTKLARLELARLELARFRPPGRGTPDRETESLDAPGQETLGRETPGWEALDLPDARPAVEPTWVASDRGLALLVRTAAPRGWRIREIGFDGTPGRAWDAEGHSKPLVDLNGETPLGWEWSDGGRRALELAEEAER